MPKMKTILQYKEKALGEVCLPWLLPPELPQSMPEEKAQDQIIKMIAAITRGTEEVNREQQIKAINYLLSACQKGMKDLSHRIRSIHWISSQEGSTHITPKMRWKVHLTSGAIPKGLLSTSVHIHGIPEDLHSIDWPSTHAVYDPVTIYAETIDAYSRTIHVEERPREQVLLDDAIKDIKMVVHEELDWVDKYYEEILHYRGNWIALSSNGIVGIGKNMREAAEQARLEGVVEPFLFEVPTTEDLEKVLVV